MIFFLVFCVTGVFSLSKICLPTEHEAHVNTRTNAWSDDKDRMSHHHDEYYEGDFLHVWWSAKAQKTLVHVYEEEWFNHQGETHHIFSLRDYQKKFHWRGHWNYTTQTVTNCQLMLSDRPWTSQYCLTRDDTQANLTSSGFVGQHAAVDFYSYQYKNDSANFFEDVHMILERGSTSYVMQERVFGEHFNTTEQKLWKWVEHREWFDLNENDIPSTKFTVPAGCPNP